MYGMHGEGSDAAMHFHAEASVMSGMAGMQDPTAATNGFCSGDMGMVMCVYRVLGIALPSWMRSNDINDLSFFHRCNV
jgi:hypothetical protein